MTGDSRKRLGIGVAAVLVGGALAGMLSSRDKDEVRLAAGEVLARKHGVVTALDPSDSDLWGNAVESMKLVQSVGEAFGALNRLLVACAECPYTVECYCHDPTCTRYPGSLGGSGEKAQNPGRAAWPAEPSR